MIDEKEVLKILKRYEGRMNPTAYSSLEADVVNVPTVEAIPKADYENRLKADMVAMLTEIQLEIEELDSRAGYSGGGMPTFSTDYIRKKEVNELIQQKINSLKEGSRC